MKRDNKLSNGEINMIEEKHHHRKKAGGFQRKTMHMFFTINKKNRKTKTYTAVALITIIMMCSYVPTVLADTYPLPGNEHPYKSNGERSERFWVRDFNNQDNLYTHYDVNRDGQITREEFEARRDVPFHNGVNDHGMTWEQFQNLFNQEIIIDRALVTYLEDLGVDGSKITSGYRNSNYNQWLQDHGFGSTSGSYHQTGKAADVLVRGNVEEKAVKALEEIRAHGGHGGVGIYSDPDRLHIDSRTNGPATWDNRPGNFWTEDLDNDGQMNKDDLDIDGDGIPNNQDSAPLSPNNQNHGYHGHHNNLQDPQDVWDNYNDEHDYTWNPDDWNDIFNDEPNNDWDDDSTPPPDVPPEPPVEPTFEPAIADVWVYDFDYEV